LRAKPSNPYIRKRRAIDCFVAVVPRNGTSSRRTPGETPGPIPRDFSTGLGGRHVPQNHSLWLWVPRSPGRRRGDFQIQFSNSERVCVRILAARNAEVCVTFSPSHLAEGAGKAGCRLHPWAPCKESTGVGPQVNRKHAGFPCAVVYDLLRALPGDRALLPPSLHGMIRKA
jgi:hypothetical protein